MISPVTGSIIVPVISVVESDTAVSSRIRPDPHTPFFLQSPAGLYLLNLLVSLVVTSTVDLTAAYERLGFTTEQAQLAATQAAGSMVSTIITAVIAIGLYALVYSGLKKGRNWARILGIVLAILSAIGTVFGVFGSLLFGGWAVVLIALTVAVLIVDILWLITAFKAPVRAWFTYRS